MHQYIDWDNVNFLPRTCHILSTFSVAPGLVHGEEPGYEPGYEAMWPPFMTLLNERQLVPVLDMSHLRNVPPLDQ